MAETATRIEQTAAPEPQKLVPAREVDLRRAARMGLIAGLALVFVAAVGMVMAFQTREVIVGLSFANLLLLTIPFVFGYIGGTPPEQREGFEASRPGSRNVVAGAIAGAIAGVIFGLFVAFINAFDIRDIFLHFSPELVDTLTLSGGLGASFGFYLLGGAVLGSIGGAAHLLVERWRRPLSMAVTWVVVVGLLEALVKQLFRGAGLPGVNSFLFEVSGLSIAGAVIVFAVFFALYVASGRREKSLRESFYSLPESERRKRAIVGMVVLLLLIAVLPRILGVFLSEVADLAGIFLLMALGLNIVVGFAGLLDLGYVAFFAIGAYTAGVLTSPSAPAFSPEMTFFLALPFVAIAAAFSGIVVGVPVLRMRGDYLAIVTLGFGEIARILFFSDALSGTFGGAQGIINIPNIVVGPIELQGSQAFFYAIFGLAIVAAYVTYALEDSRMGRAWMAMREDESVAEAMGVNIVAAKLYAFIIGAILGGLGGALFATKIGAIFPSSFSVVVSINILIIVIIGGLGSVPGVLVGAFVLVGLPELLREFDEFRFLTYGAVLIFMMLKKPEGFIPSRRRAAELHEDEIAQDEWLRQEQIKQEKAEAVPSEA
ncbi:MAG: branched-chain amino acid ABC transporter permease [Actinomycetota bacterium]